MKLHYSSSSLGSDSSATDDTENIKKIRSTRQEEFDLQISKDKFNTIHRRRLYNATENEKDQVKSPKPDKSTSKEQDDYKFKIIEDTSNVEAILKAANDLESDPGKLYFLVKIKDEDECALLKAEKANKELPQMVIQFYEQRLNWVE